MLASQQISRINQTQSALAFFALLNFYQVPEDAIVRANDSYDYVVIGGGTAGGVVAARLVEANFSVLVIEAGGNPSIEHLLPGFVTYLKHSRTDWNFTAYNDCITGRCKKPGYGPLLGKVLGGTGATNYMIYERGHPGNYENFYKVTRDPSWKWNNMIKYFKKSEKLQSTEILNSPYRDYHGTEGKIGVTKENRPACDDYLRGFEEAGETVVTDNVGAGILGYSTGLYHISDGVRNNVINTYWPSIVNNSNLYLTTNSLATRIIFDDRKNAVGVEFVKEGQTITVKAKKEIIVSAGPLKSPQLLMLSGIGPKEQLKGMNISVLSNIPVGKNLQNDVGVLLAFKTNKKAIKQFNVNMFPTPFIVGYSTLNKSKSCSRNPDYGTYNFIIDDSEYFLSLCAFTMGFNNSICDRLHLSSNGSQMLVTNVIRLNPKSRGQVLLRSKDPNDQPKLFSNYYTNDVDLEAVVTFVQDYMKIVKTPYFKSMGLEFLEATDKCRQFEFGSREYWRCYALCMIVGTARHSGTCSMGSVVDSKLNVLGVKRLRVAGSCVMPNTVGGSKFAAEVALAEKAAEMIIKSSRS